MITLKLKSGLDKVIGKNVIELEIPAEKKLCDILQDIRFPLSEARVVLVDGKRSHLNCVLHGGETVKLFPFEPTTRNSDY